MAFHPYPQVIRPVFNLGRFGPPRSLTSASPCPWIDHLASGLRHATVRPVQTRFRSGYPSRVNLATHRNSLAHSSKGTPSQPRRAALTACRPTVSGTISLPSRGTFHLSLTVLVRYRSPTTYLALRGGPRGFTPAFTAPALLGMTSRSSLSFAYGALTLCGAPFQSASTRERVCNCVGRLVPSLDAPTTPNWQGHQALPPARFRLIPFRSPLLRESLLLSVPRATEMFQFARSPLPALCVQTGVTPHDGCRVSPFGHPRINA